jgi:hypothetical protein
MDKVKEKRPLICIGLVCLYKPAERTRAFLLLAVSPTFSWLLVGYVLVGESAGVS